MGIQSATTKMLLSLPHFAPSSRWNHDSSINMALDCAALLSLYPVVEGRKVFWTTTQQSLLQFRCPDPTAYMLYCRCALSRKQADLRVVKKVTPLKEVGVAAYLSCLVVEMPRMVELGSVGKVRWLVGHME
ncbi:hypothetical protein L2E82_45242 [Cichorium intybus]|uniref:Uncharacterized protein n=1 Tax=Cichorium intybus TaxID=13427 RepID=A0ACB8ZSZ9_CICIN|nr:hypothetical protein L2E82_45242 [Cichorium intybus]